jgi:malonyl-CoA O-methyltransferase
MAEDRPPTIDPAAAAARWQRAAPAASPWLHEEVARRMEERLQWIKRAPAAWADWEPVRGGLAAHAPVAARYPQATRTTSSSRSTRRRARGPGQALVAPPGRPGAEFGPVPDGGVQMVWANMQLHMAADPQALMRSGSGPWKSTAS